MAKQLAKELNYIYIDTGAMYRAITLYCLNEGFITKEETDLQGIIENLDQINVSFRRNQDDGKLETILNEVNVETEIRTLYVSSFVSRVSAIKAVRVKLVDLQQKMAQEGGVVMDGRDIGSVVLPQAELKLFVTASDEVRAKRRLLEMQEKGESGTFEEVLENLRQRDYLDSTRAESPLVQVEDAIVVDNSDLTRQEQLTLVLDLANARM